MKSWRAWFTLLLCWSALLARPGFASALHGDPGFDAQIAAPAKRIVALAPHLTEIAFAAGAGDRLVGVARYSDYPPRAHAIQQIGDAARVDIERILTLNPDLVLAWRSGNQAGDIARLQALGYRVVTTEPRRLEDIPRLLRTVGRLAGTADVARRAALTFDAEIAALRERYAGRMPVRVFYEIWHRPLLTVNGDHMISDVIAVCGGVNAFSGVPVLTPAVSIESVLAARPQAILGGSSSVTPGQFVAQWRGHAVAEFRRLPAFHIPPDEIQRATPRILAGARAICRYLENVRQKPAPDSGVITSGVRTGP